MVELSYFLSQVLLLVWQWIRSIGLFFIPKSLRCKDIKSDVVLITGGGSGIGQLLAKRLHNRGAKIILWDINKQGLQASKNALGDERVWTYTCDVSNREAVYECAARVRQDVGQVTMLVNNAGIVSGKSFLDLKDAEIERTMGVNIMAHFWTCKAFLPDMLATNHGHLVFIASIAGLSGAPHLSDYCASKFATIGLEESIRAELRCNNITGVHSTVVCPWFINTGMFSGARSDVIPFQEPEYVADQIELGILSNQEVLFIPRFMYFLNTLKTLMPTHSSFYLLRALGGDTSMQTFVGRK